MNKIYSKLKQLLDEELTSLELGHNYNENRINLMFNMLVMIGYLQFADITNNEISSIINFYKNV